MHFVGAGNLSAWLPPDASYQAVQMDSAFSGIFMAAAFAVVVVVGLAAFYIGKYRRKDENEKAFRTGKANVVFQAIWVLCAVGLALYAFNLDFCGYLDQTVAPGNSLQIDVTARQWDYDFVYPNGYVADTLHVTMGQPVQLNISSEDVVHTVTIPALRLNQAAIPGQTSTAWFLADTPDTFNLRSNIYSGEGYPGMQTALVVHTARGYETWMDAVTDIFAGRTMEEVGQMLYDTKGCKACHSLDGSKLVGPSLKDVYGNTFATKDGVDIVVDDAYVKESLMTPNASVIAGFEPVMTPYEGKLNDKEVLAITEWLKSISQFAQTEGN